nr:DUF4352 domain-containing protein [Alkalibacillus almallahensis]
MKWGAIILVAIIVIGAFMSDSEEDTADSTAEDQTEGTNSDQESNDESSDSEGSNESEESSSEGENTTQVGIGEPAAIADVSFTVNGVEEVSEIDDGNEFTEPATTSGKFVIVDVTIGNDKSESITIDSSFFKLFSSDGVEYEPASDGNVMMNMADEDNFFLEQVNPGLEKSGKVVFEVGGDLDVASSTLQGQTGFWGTEKVEIALQ